eukprot:TRINITY_DN604_c0_g1_i15.p2 TRINITY_DN604_c0_g1~~TRINITY_DN604_c0_g1_i15.p2  ORF type:complete len:122 (-),score=28.17 TRINITY_DN604_c0_g1_i15:54-419(-)
MDEGSLDLSQLILGVRNRRLTSGGMLQPGAEPGSWPWVMSLSVVERQVEVTVEIESVLQHAGSGWHQACSSISDFPVLCVDTCLLYTSDAADEEDSVDLGGRRIIKKKKKKKEGRVGASHT